MKNEFYEMRPAQLQVGLMEMINHIKEADDVSNMTMVEIGSYTGESSIIFAQHFKKVICIDPFLNDYDKNDITCQYADFDLVYKKFLENTANYSNISLIRKKSDDAVKDLKDETIGFVYIDGIHTYEQVTNDINNYKPLIKGSFIGGHDYSDNWIGVKNAIDRLLDSPHKIFSDTSWIVNLK